VLTQRITTSPGASGVQEPQQCDVMHVHSTMAVVFMSPYSDARWCNSLVCGNHTQHVLHYMTSPLVSVLFVPSLHSYYFSRKILFFSVYIVVVAVVVVVVECDCRWRFGLVQLWLL